MILINKLADSKRQKMGNQASLVLKHFCCEEKVGGLSYLHCSFQM